MRDRPENHRTLRVALLPALLAGLLAACGGGGTTGSPVQGKAIDGYLAGATICLDVNRNGACDSDEPQSVTDSAGSYSFTLPDGYDNAGFEFLADVPPTAVDSDNPGTLVGKSFVMRTPFYMRSAITPLTTVVSAHVASGMGLEAAKAQAATDLGLPAGFDFAKDYVADSDVNAHNAAKVVARVLQTQPSASAAAILAAVDSYKAAIATAAATSTPYTSVELDSNVASVSPEAPLVSATVPTATPVISIYSDTYTSVSGVDTNPNWSQATKVRELQVATGDKLLQMAGLDYQGLTFPVQDVSAMNSLHVDVWSQSDGEVKLGLITSGTQTGGEPLQTDVTMTLTAGWNAINIALGQYSKPDLTKIDQMVWATIGAARPTVYVDNLYFWNDPDQPADTPYTAAPTPTAAASDVIAVYGDTYSTITGVALNPNWGQSTQVSEIDLVAGNKAVKLSDLNYQGIDFAGNKQDVSGMSYLHVDVWSASAGTVNLYLISATKGEQAKALTLAAGWNSFDIALADFGVEKLADVMQFKWADTSVTTIFYDNLYFHKDATRPYTAAPTPTAAASDVIAVYGDTYSTITGVALNPNWGQSTQVSEIDLVAGNKAVKLSDLNYQGIDFAGNKQDVSGMSYLHVDVWSASAGTVNLYLISATKGEQAKALTLAAGWNSFDIALADFGVEKLADVMQFKWADTSVTTIFYDNLYFKK